MVLHPFQRFGPFGPLVLEHLTAVDLKYVVSESEQEQEQKVAQSKPESPLVICSRNPDLVGLTLLTASLSNPAHQPPITYSPNKPQLRWPTLYLQFAEPAYMADESSNVGSSQPYSDTGRIFEYYNRRVGHKTWAIVLSESTLPRYDVASGWRRKGSCGKEHADGYSNARKLKY